MMFRDGKTIISYLFLCFTFLWAPGCGEKPAHNANWYYYWEKDGIVPYLNRTGSPVSRWDWSVDALNQGVYGASHGPSDGFVLTDLCILEPIQPQIQVRHKYSNVPMMIGAETAYGIQQVAATSAHERQHILNWREVHNGNPDTDGDGLADRNEGENSAWQFVIGETDTYDLARYIHIGYAAYGDNEFIARQAEQAGVQAVNSEQDWSVGGAQW